MKVNTIHALAISLFLQGVIWSPALAIQDRQKLEVQPQHDSGRVIRNPATTLRMPSHSITVSVQGDNALGGRRVNITVRKGRSSRSQTVSLNNSGDATVPFPLGSVPTIAHGNYTIHVSKVNGDPAHYASSANYCFDGTQPASHATTIDAAHRNVRVNFALRASIAWNRQGYCW